MKLAASLSFAVLALATISNAETRSNIEHQIESADVFNTGISPVGRSATSLELGALATAIRTPEVRIFPALRQYVQQFPRSPFNPSLNLGLGLELEREGALSQAQPLLLAALTQSRSESSQAAQSISVRALAELALLRAKAGDAAGLRAIIEDARSFNVSGAASERLHLAREQLHEYESNRGDGACARGALIRLAGALDRPAPNDWTYPWKERRTSLAELGAAADSLHLPVRAVFRKQGEAIPVPSIAHLQIGHYVFVKACTPNSVTVEDPGFEGAHTYRRSAFDGESSGYFLAPLSCRLRQATPPEMEGHSGAGYVGNLDPTQTGDNAPTANPPCGSMPLARFDFQLLVAGLTIFDSPVGYTPTVGPNLKVEVRYNQREYNALPANFSSFGPKWVSNFFSLIQYDTSQPASPPTVYVRDGGTTSDALDTYNCQSRALIHMVSLTPLKFQRELPDGSVENFAYVSGSTSLKNVYMTSISDAWGNAATLQYDNTHGVRLKTITDPFGRLTTFSYTNTANPYLITKIEDPFGRSCSFSYNSAEYLDGITDIIGITSSFTYASKSDFIEKLQTPYGTTTFTSDQNNASNNYHDRYIQAKDADGLSERVEYDGDQPTASNLQSSDPIAPVGVANEYLDGRNAFYWDKKNFPSGYGDGSSPNYLLATIYHFYHSTDIDIASGVVEAIGRPLESRTWLNYEGQSNNGLQLGPNTIGSSPSMTERSLNNGATIARYSVPNQLGHPVEMIDALGRMTTFSYGYNNIDLNEEAIVDYSSGFFVSYPIYQASNYQNHKPRTIVDRAGGVTKVVYNSFGQVSKTTDPFGQVTQFNYGPHGFLSSIVGPSGQIISSFAPDSYDRVAQQTDAAGSVTNFTYDAADRILTKGYSDGTKDSFIYPTGQIEPGSSTDRQGRTTKYIYTPIHQLKTKTDPAGRVTTFAWCSCGQLASVTDPRGYTTQFLRDIEGRLIGKKYADGSQTVYTYEPDSGRLSTSTDALIQTKTYSYNMDGSIASIIYGPATENTPSVSYTYDPIVARISSMTDGTGTSTFNYYPDDLTPGSGQLQSVSRTDGAETKTYTYDALNRQLSRQVGTTIEAFTYDPIGRISKDVNLLATFQYSYLNSSNLIESITGGVVNSTCGYQSEPMPVRLKSLSNSVGASTLDAFTYTYDQAGAISSWSKALPGTTASPNLGFSYDHDDWLTGWQEKSTGGATKANNTFEYDDSGNRIAWLDPSGQASAPTAANKVNEMSEIQVVTPETSTLLATYSYKYDLNGSLTKLVDKTSNSTSTTNITWDGENRIASLSDATGTTAFTYGADNLVHESVFTPIDGGTSTTTFLDWDGEILVAMRTAAGTKHFFLQGVVETDGTKLYYSRDHLSSIREVVDSSGKTVAQYQYGPYGLRSQVSGTYDSDLGYAGYINGPFLFSPFRAYDPFTGRWLSRDPVGESGGLNLYAYVNNQPTTLTDKLGLTLYITIYANPPPGGGSSGDGSGSSGACPNPNNGKGSGGDGGSGGGENPADPLFTAAGAIVDYHGDLFDAAAEQFPELKGVGEGLGALGLGIGLAQAAYDVSTGQETFLQADLKFSYGTLGGILGAEAGLLAGPLAPLVSPILGVAGSFAGEALGQYVYSHAGFQ